MATLTPDELRRVERTLSAGTWTITLGAVLFSVLTVTPLVQRVTPDEWRWTAPILPIVVDAAVVIVIRMDATVSRLGERGGSWPTVLRWLTGVMTLTLNVGDSALKGDLVGVAVHAVAPLLLIVTAEAALAYRRAISRALERIARERAEAEARERAEVAAREQRARREREQREERERLERERERAARERAEAAAREHELQRERERREAERERRDWEAAQEREREERERRERLEREERERQEQERERRERREREERERQEREAKERQAREEAERRRVHEQQEADRKRREREQQRRVHEQARAQAEAPANAAPTRPANAHAAPAMNTPPRSPVNASVPERQMSEEQAQAFIARHFADMSVRQIAAQTGWSVGWISPRVKDLRAGQEPITSGTR